MLSLYEAMGFAPAVRLLPKGRTFAAERADWLVGPGCLYAFVSGGDVKYVGLTINALNTRLENYRYGGDQCRRIRENILSEIEAGNEVWVYAREISDRSELEREEGRLRRDHKPPWNRA